MALPLAGKTVTVSIGGDLNTDQLSQVLQNIFQGAGHRFCTSGMTILFRQESELYSDPDLGVRSTLQALT
jgi:hypothetical protein